MDKNVKALLKEYATIYVAEGKAWESVFRTNKHLNGTPEHDEMRRKYSVLVADTDKKRADLAQQLADAGYPVCTYRITGQAPNDVSHYDIDDIVAAAFDDQVVVDSESGQLFIFATGRVYADVASTIDYHVGPGTVTLYGGDEYPAWTKVEKMGPSEYIVKGLGNWSAAEKMLKELSEEG